LHLVHVRRDVLLKDALRKPDGVAVIGVFIVIGHDGSSIAAFSPTFENLVYPGGKLVTLCRDNNTTLLAYK
uniref:Alpha-carbonic anhydrase domain-containing protein n=1 Tax=Angiostrongylus cantonensis TaxID=6313 RepID=A0A0K0DPH4_ANGCA